MNLRWGHIHSIDFAALTFLWSPNHLHFRKFSCFWGTSVNVLYIDGVKDNTYSLYRGIDLEIMYLQYMTYMATP